MQQTNTFMYNYGYYLKINILYLIVYYFAHDDYFKLTFITFVFLKKIQQVIINKLVLEYQTFLISFPNKLLL